MNAEFPTDEQVRQAVTVAWAGDCECPACSLLRGAPPFEVPEIDGTSWNAGHVEARIREHLAVVNAVPADYPKQDWLERPVDDPHYQFGYRIPTRSRCVVFSSEVIAEQLAEFTFDEGNTYLDAVEFQIDSYLANYDQPTSTQYEMAITELANEAPGSLAILNRVQLAAMDRSLGA